MTFEEFIHQGANTAGISNVSTRGQPIGYPAPCKANIKKSIRIAIDENPNLMIMEKSLMILSIGAIHLKVITIGATYIANLIVLKNNIKNQFY